MRKREISDFMARELLYDYVRGKLDRETFGLVDQSVKNSDDLRKQLDSIRFAQAYCNELKKLRVTSELMTQLSTSRRFTQVKKTIKNLSIPSGLKLGLQTFVVSLLAGALVVLLVYGDKQSFLRFFERPKDFKLAETEVVTSHVPTGEEGDPETDDLDESDEEPAEGGAPARTTEIVDLEKPVQMAKPIESVRPIESTVPVPDLPIVAKNDVPSPSPAAVPSKTEEKTNVAPAVLPKGFVYLAKMKIKSLDDVNSIIVDQITGLGGQKAGQVRLGWRKASGSYFHFTLPEAQLKKFQETMEAYGSFKLKKEVHERVMPSGLVRIILELEDDIVASPTEVSEPEPEKNPSDVTTEPAD